VLTSELSSAQPCSGVGVNLSERAKKMRHAEMKLDLRVRIDALLRIKLSKVCEEEVSRRRKSC
jgi:hypothetical protein